MGELWLGGSGWRMEVIPTGRGSISRKRWDFLWSPEGLGAASFPQNLWEWSWEGLEIEHPWDEEKGGDQETANPWMCLPGVGVLTPGTGLIFFQDVPGS